MSPLHRRCVIEATIEPLSPFRRGYARSKIGPFFGKRTVRLLLRTGALRKIVGGWRPRVTAMSKQ